MRISSIFTSVNNKNSNFYQNCDKKAYLPNNPTFNRIDNSKMAYLSENAQSLVKTLKDNLEILIEKRNFISYLSDKKQAKIRNGFPDYIPQAGKAMFFKLEDKIVSISKHRGSRGDILKIYSTNTDKSEPELFMIEDNDKVISNVIISTPNQLPQKFRYMTEDELRKSKVMSYVKGLNDKIVSYIDFMKECIEPIQIEDGVLSDDTRLALENVTNYFNTIKQNIDIAKTKYKSPAAITRIKSKYPYFIHQTGPQRYSFKHEDKILYLAKTLSEEANFVRFVVKDLQQNPLNSFLVNAKEGKIFLHGFLMNVPKNPRYLTNEQIKEYEVEKYLLAACEHLKKFNETIALEIDNRMNEQIKNRGKEGIENKNKRSTSDEGLNEPQKIKEKTERKPRRLSGKKKQNLEPKNMVSTGNILYGSPKKGDLLPEFDGAKRKEFPKDLKLSEIDELFEEITGQSLNKVTGVKGSAPIPQPAAFKKEVIIKLKENNKGIGDVKKADVNDDVVSMPTPLIKKIIKVEPTIWGLAKYLDENSGFVVATRDGVNISVALNSIEDFEYISLVKKMPNNKKKYFNIDCDTQKLLKTDLTRKPMLQNGNVIPYTENELKTLGLQNELEAILEEMFTLLNGEEETNALEPKIKMLQKEDVVDNKREIVAEDIIEKAKLDAREYAEEYFNAFIEEFKKVMLNKLEDFEKIKDEILGKFNK